MKALPCIVMLALTLVGQVGGQDVPPLAPLRGDAASLKDTMKFIQDKLPSKVNYMVYGHDNVTGADNSTKRSFELSNVSVDASRCSISFHGRFDDGKAVSDHDGVLDLKRVREIALTQVDQEIQQSNAEAGHPEWSIKVEPPVALVVVKYGPNQWMMFNFYDESLSERVSKALQHAVELCGGGNPDPF